MAKKIQVEKSSQDSVKQSVKMRLKRAGGHLNKVISMIEEDQKCLSVSQQLHAVIKALEEAKKTIIHDHFEHCLNADKINSEDVKEFKAIAKFL